MHPNEVELAPDELVMLIDINWSDGKGNQVRRTLNEVSILERDMRHGKIKKSFSDFQKLNYFRIIGNEKTRISGTVQNILRRFSRYEKFFIK